jgi:hypothetical protein
MQIKRCEELIELSRSRVSEELPVETHASYPIPVRGKKVLVLYGVSVLKPDGLYLLAPGHMGRLDAETGELESLRPVTPADLGQKHAPLAVLGTYNMLRAVKDPAEFLDLQRRLYEDYDLLLPRFYDGQSSLDATAGRAAAEFSAVFRRVSEDVLWPYYEGLGKDFFGWLSRVARL